MQPRMKSSHLDRILGKIEDLDTLNLTILVQRLARERKLLESVFNTIREGVILIDESGVIEYLNFAANKLVGLSEQDLGSVKLWKCIPELAEAFQSNKSKIGALSAQELEIHYPEHRFVRLYVVPIEFTDESQEERFAVILSDITEEKKRTEAQIEDEKFSSIFLLAAGVAHEIGNPLNSINIHLQLINRQLNKLDKDFRIEKIKDSVETCRSEVDRLDGIIQNFLRAIRPVKPEMNDLHLLKILDEVISLQSEELQNLNITVEVDIKSEPPIVLGDRNQIKQIFFNVLKNSMESMDTGGEIAISTQSNEDRLLISFQDSGKGMDEETLAHLFEPYFSTKPTGHGLGMMIVQRIMQAHGGSVLVESLQAKGTAVTLSFPLKSKRMKLLESSEG